MKIVLIEDELLAAKRLEKLILEFAPDAEIMVHLESIEQTIEWWKQTKTYPDLIFMDIQLADGKCFEIFKSIDIQQPIIFTTAYDNFALQSFEQNTLDYLLKPIKADELQRALKKYQGKTSPSKNEFQQRFLVTVGSTSRVITIQEIAYIFTLDKLTFAITNDGKKHPLDFTLEQLEEKLDPELFFRLNRQVISKLASIKELLSHTKSRLKVILNPPFPTDIVISSEKTPQFKKWVGKS